MASVDSGHCLSHDIKLLSQLGLKQLSIAQVCVLSQRGVVEVPIKVAVDNALYMSSLSVVVETPVEETVNITLA